MKRLNCPRCQRVLFLESSACPDCGALVGYHAPSHRMLQVSDGVTEVDGQWWRTCRNEDYCNWLVSSEVDSDECFACRVVRRRPDPGDATALAKLARTMPAQHRLLAQLSELELPVDPWFEGAGGLGFDLISSQSTGERVIIGHSNGIITIDLMESLDAHREQLRVNLGEPYRTMLGHFRHEAGHFYQWNLVEQTAWIDECRTLFGDERASYQEAIARHYEHGAPADWSRSFISEYATMHPWEDFAETFAHYLHITDALGTAAAAELSLGNSVAGPGEPSLRPLEHYGAEDFGIMMRDWYWVSLFFNRANRSIGKGDLYPFTITAPAAAKLEFIHRVVTGQPQWRTDPRDGFRRRTSEAAS